ncbi:MAG: hypothetical protein KAW42_06245 [Candidatus Atribacteria bacterium]|nr:hypothetical protein [Candidatus Atribacteria bacterium]
MQGTSRNVLLYACIAYNNIESQRKLEIEKSSLITENLKLLSRQQQTLIEGNVRLIN